MNRHDEQSPDTWRTRYLEMKNDRDRLAQALAHFLESWTSPQLGSGPRDVYEAEMEAATIEAQAALSASGWPDEE